jgi:hypothetical protein
MYCILSPANSRIVLDNTTISTLSDRFPQPTLATAALSKPLLSSKTRGSAGYKHRLKSPTSLDKQKREGEAPPLYRPKIVALDPTFCVGEQPQHQHQQARTLPSMQAQEQPHR